MNTPLSKNKDEIDRDVMDTLYRVVKIRDGYKLGPEYFASLQAGRSEFGRPIVGRTPVAVNKGISFRPQFVNVCQYLSRVLKKIGRRLGDVK